MGWGPGQAAFHSLPLIAGWTKGIILLSCICMAMSTLGRGGENGVATGQQACCPAGRILSPPRDSPNMAFIIGSQKSGTTWLFDELVSRHPSIRSQARKPASKRINQEKEPEYFNQLVLADFKRYLDAFALSGDLNNSSLVFLDGTPDYMHIPSAACRIAATFPNARLVALLREPASRALSQWNMIQRRRKKQVSSFGVEVRGEMRKLQAKGCSFEPVRGLNGSASGLPDSDVVPRPNLGPGQTWSRRAGIPSWNSCFRCVFFNCGSYSGPARAKAGPEARAAHCSHVFPRHGIVRRGIYVYQLEWWLSHFPRQQMMVLNHEQALQDREGTLDQVISFLGLDIALKSAPNEGSVSGWSLPLPKNVSAFAGALAELGSFYSDANHELYRMMDQWPESGWKGVFTKPV